ncbi:6-phospho-beta-glucosidase [Streptomyces sp. NPDC057545]|uniref:family 4 glycosyl hydrolase n=1 Tax=Streptomyces sp. NPDC057545 TaxID=3346164 RepID=UPI0036CB7A82
MHERVPLSVDSTGVLLIRRLDSVSALLPSAPIRGRTAPRTRRRVSARRYLTVIDSTNASRSCRLSEPLTALIRTANGTCFESTPATTTPVIGVPCAGARSATWRAAPSSVAISMLAEVGAGGPAGLVTEAMARHLGDRVIGICDSPVGLGRRLARILGADPDRAWIDYVGLNHLGWVRGLRVDGRDELPRLLADPGLLGSFEEGRLFGADWIRSLGAVPNEYLHYYYFNREAVRAYQAAEQTRGAFLREQQEGFYARTKDPGTSALTAWNRTRAEREATYMSENREAAGAGDRDESDLDSGGYEKVALALMRAVARNERTSLILNVRNRTTLSVLDADAVIEVPCLVDASGAHPVAVDPLPYHAVGLVTAVKAVERAVLDAADSGSRAAAVKAFALHPLVDSVTVAERLVDGYLKVHPGLRYLDRP